MLISQKAKHSILETGIFLKGINGVLQISLGFIILFLNSHKINGFIDRLLSHELAHDPKDLMAQYIINFSRDISISTKDFIGIYILVHGIINLFLFYNIWNDKKKMYPASIIILLLLAAYQIIRFYFSHSIFLFFITLVDLVIIYLLADYLKTKSD